VLGAFKAPLVYTPGEPVLLLNGDSHGFRSDDPLLQGAPCLTEAPGDQAAVVTCADDAYANQPNGYHNLNFHRLTVHGSTANMEWLKLDVKPYDRDAHPDANSFGPFSWQRMIQPLPPAS
jgi:hypothetical protein